MTGTYHFFMKIEVDLDNKLLFEKRGDICQGVLMIAWVFI
jgi:hypothetical protein